MFAFLKHLLNESEIFGNINFLKYFFTICFFLKHLFKKSEIFANINFHIFHNFVSSDFYSL